MHGRVIVRVRVHGRWAGWREAARMKEDGACSRRRAEEARTLGRQMPSTMTSFVRQA